MEKFIKKMGFSPTKAFLISIIGLFLASVVANTGLTLQGVNTGLGLKAAGICLVLGILIAFLMVGIGNFVRRAVWSSNGYKGTPVMFFFLLNADGKTTVTHDVLLNFESMLPRELLEDICSEPGTVGGSEAVDKINGTEKLVFVFNFLVLAIVAFLLFWLGQPVIGGSCLFAIVLIAILGRTRAKTFHGADVQCKYYKEGFGIYYVIRQAAAMGLPLKNLIEEFGDLETEYYEDVCFTYYSLIDWQGIFLEKALSESGEPDIDPVLFSLCKNEKMRNFPYRKLYVTRMKLNLNDIYMCYLLLHGSKEEKDEMVNGFYANLSTGTNARGATLQQELNWRADLVYGRPVDINAYPLFRPVDFLKSFPTYQSNAEKIKAKVKAL